MPAPPNGCRPPGAIRQAAGLTEMRRPGQGAALASGLRKENDRQDSKPTRYRKAEHGTSERARGTPSRSSGRATISPRWIPQPLYGFVRRHASERRLELQRIKLDQMLAQGAVSWRERDLVMLARRHGCQLEQRRRLYRLHLQALQRLAACAALLPSGAPL